MNDRFDLFDQIGERLPKILAALVMCLVVVLIGLDIVLSIDLSVFWGGLGANGSNVAALPGCITMADGLVVCDAP